MGIEQMFAGDVRQAPDTPALLARRLARDAPPPDDGGSSGSSDSPGIEAPPAIGQDERRMHVRAYNHWAKLLDGRSFPAIDTLDVQNLGDFGDHAVLLDFRGGLDDPAVGHLGAAIAEECEATGPIATISDVPRRSLLSRLTDHYLQIIANRAPIGFEAEFVNASGVTILYRGVLLPFSSDNDTIDYILGVINWKEAAPPALEASIAAEMVAAQESAPPPRPTMPVWGDGPSEHIEDDADTVAEAETALPNTPDEDVAIGDALASARQAAQRAASVSARGHAALYRALALASAFAGATRAAPDDYAELLEDSGIKASPRSPMTAVVKLVFGTDADKTRLAEYSAVLGWAEDEGLAPQALETRLGKAPGGVKGLLRDIRAAKRGERPAADPLDQARLKAAAAAPLARLRAIDGLPDTPLIALLARREADGTLTLVHADGSGPATGPLLRSLSRRVRAS